ncbi:amidohydrolase family protein [Gracilibacillus caseinilyticus]|uniref:Amidohydrolase family protein n=1 Tax=Gracilibacillus caseinilyticus TaxID=2932256 RepID=A0ABY4EQY1_9BACI|nr:amidohydrolase family protein [Gracilibacillus caseinilyticus]UOQ46603.1 amidohydrolase family protein [Gracilibacillus caseinilyticus]
MVNVIKNVKIAGEWKDLIIKEGMIKEIKAASNVADTDSYDARGLLYLPAFQDMHCHLDKHLVGEQWRSLQPFITLPKQLQFEKSLLETMENDVNTRVRLMAELMLQHGTTKIRTHVDIDRTLGLKHLEAVVELRKQMKGIMEIEIVAFPQQGLLLSDSVDVAKDALRNGADLIGGVDPAGLEKRVDASLETMFSLSKEFAKGIDLHLHDPGHLGKYTIDRVTELTKQAKQEANVAVSHAYCLGMLSDDELQDTYQALRENDISIISSVPIDRPMPRLQSMIDNEISFLVGTDNIQDAWSPFGDGDILRRGSRLAEKNGWVTDEQLIAAYSYITGRSLEPVIGEKADFVLVDAQNIQQAMAIVPRREAVFAGGNVIAEKGELLDNCR